MELNPWELRSPSELIRQVAGEVPLTDGTALAVVVDDPSRAQQIKAVKPFAYGAYLDDYELARDPIEELCERWESTKTKTGRLTVVTVVVRRGLCVWSPVEWAWSMAWRYAMKGHISGGDLITVTEHGWYDVMTDHADHRPALVESHAHH